MKSYDDHVVSFSGQRVGTQGHIELYTTFDEGEASKTTKIRYLVIYVNTSYNILLGWQSINRLRALISTPHLAMKFLSVSGNIVTVHVDQKLAQELVEVLWAYRCTSQISTQETPHNLTYDVKAMITVEVGEPSHKRQLFDLSLNQESLSVRLDLLNELRDNSKIHETAYKLQAAKWYNNKVRSRSFQKGDLVWRMLSEVRKTDEKFSFILESPFLIQDVTAEGAYHLK